MILTNEEDLAKKINSAVFPGLQGGPLMHVIAAKAVALREALRPSSRPTPSGGRQRQGAGPADSCRRLQAGHRRHRQPPDAGRPDAEGADRQGGGSGAVARDITCNKNGMPFDPQKPMVTSGIRLGSPAATSAASASPNSARSAS